ncbi:hypothetical protein EDD16DRAFT_1517736 [Pisolithus croceorrhizus]|nr:hypothetical protein EDD16DRAFT_1517736 [Pisolithus croceorrhizus]
MKKYDGNGMLAAVAVKEGRKKQKETTTVINNLTEKLIVNEAAKITAAINKILLGCQNLTITFDGGKHTFCMELDDASQLSHTAKYILEVLEHMVTKIGPWIFCAVTSDNTGNTHKAQRLLCEKYPYHYIQDGCHLLNLAIKDICLLPEFGELCREYIDIMGYNALFQPGGQKILFELALSKLLQVTGPWAKGLQVLEAADVTADHIYYIFLGIMSQLEEDFCKNEFSLVGTQ